MEEIEFETAPCSVCEGTGKYPIFDSNGKERYSIECPECCGAGHDFGEAAELAQKEADMQFVERQREKYQAALDEMRAASPQLWEESGG